MFIIRINNACSVCGNIFTAVDSRAVTVRAAAVGN